MHKYALLFPGQGAQKPRMAKDFFEASATVRDLFLCASDVTGIDCEKLLFESDDAALRETVNTQVAVTLANLASFVALGEAGLSPEETVAVAGFSLGEYAALVAVDAISPEECFFLVKERGTIMSRHGERIIAERGAIGMAAVIGLDPDMVEKVISSRTDVFCANYNSAGQTVISGMLAGIDAVEGPLKDAGARRVLKLNVSGPFHTPLLAEAGAEFKSVLDGVTFENPRVALYSNVSGARVESGADAKALLTRQIASPVLWTSVERAVGSLLGSNDMALECGPGTVLAGLWRTANEKTVCHNASTREHVDALSREF